MGTRVLVLLIVVLSFVAAGSFYLALGSPNLVVGSLADWSAAGASVLAAGAALFIATRDRRDRRAERAAASEAQAKLVMVNPQLVIRSGRPTFISKIENYGAEPVLDVSIVRAQIGKYPNATAHLSDWPVLIVPRDKPAEVLAAFTGDDGANLPPEEETGRRGYPDIGSLNIEIWVAFADSYGNRWEKSSGGALRRLGRSTELK